MREKDFWVALNLIPGLGKTLFYRLLKFFGSAERVFSVKEKDLRQVEGVGQILAGVISQFDFSKNAEKEKQLAENSGAIILISKEPGYPENLKNIYDPPPVLYLQGKMQKNDMASIAVVGTRTPTNYGKLMAEKIAGGLAERGMTIVSGMARGVDSLAHKAAIAGGGRTIAVLGSGLNVIYPPENLKLSGKIKEHGAVLSEFPMCMKPERGNFPARNRIISGLSLGTVVIEAAEKSGALITTQFALDQGREVFAVPGNVSSPKSRGANFLIKKGAKLVEKVDDILEEIPQYVQNAFLGKAKPAAGKTLELTDEEKKLLAAIDPEASHIDLIIERSELSPGRVSSLLLTMELNGIVRQLPGKLFVAS